MVANGERVTCLGVIRSAPLSVGGDTFPMDLFIMRLAAYDVVLGTKWMAALGPIVWDFSNCFVSFQHQGRSFCWQGLAGPKAAAVSTTLASSTLLEELLREYGDHLHRAPGFAAPAQPRPQHHLGARGAAGGRPTLPLSSPAQG
jgi:hypothetical protein